MQLRSEGVYMGPIPQSSGPPGHMLHVYLVGEANLQTPAFFSLTVFRLPLRVTLSTPLPSWVLNVLRTQPCQPPWMPQSTDGPLNSSNGLVCLISMH